MTDRLDFEARLEERLRARAAIASQAIRRRRDRPSGRARRWSPTVRTNPPNGGSAGVAVGAAGHSGTGSPGRRIVAAGLLLDRSSPLAGRWTPGPMQDLHDHDRAPSAVLLDGVCCSSAARRTRRSLLPALRPPHEYLQPDRRRDGRAAYRKLRHDPARWSRAGGGAACQTGPEPARLIARSCSIRRRRRSAPRVGWSSDVSITSPRCSPTVVCSSWAFEPGSGVISAEIFDPETGSWTLAGTMLHPRFASAATLLQDGRVLVSGGMDSTSTTELFDPSTSRFEAGPSMANPRYGHASVRLADGRVLIIGGTDGNQAMASAGGVRPSDRSDPTTGSLVTERVAIGGFALRWSRACGRRTPGQRCPAERQLYDPNTGTFQQAAFATRMHLGVAHRLSDGRVLVTGDQPEVFDPSATTPVATVTPRPDGPFIATGDPIEDRRPPRDPAARRPGADPRRLVGGPGPGPDEPRVGGNLRSETGSFTAGRDARLAGAGCRRHRVRPIHARSAGRAGSRAGRSTVLVGVQVFDPATGTFGHLGSLGPEEVTVGQPIAAVQLVDGRILLFGPRSTGPRRSNPTPRPTSSTSGSHERRRSRTCRGAAESTAQWFLRTVESSCGAPTEGRTRPGCSIQAPAGRRSSTLSLASAARWSCWPTGASSSAAAAPRSPSKTRF